MNREAKNEIDLMLRQLGRREGAAHSDERAHAQHLDADELNSYVANALPAAARARYMEHLADCGSCRKLVAQLTAAQGPVVVAHTESIPAPSGLKQFLASLFSPMVLRYAVPALGVLAIMIVGFVIMRRETARESVAQLMDQNQNESVAVASPSPEAGVFGLNDEQGKRAAEPAAPKRSASQGESSAESAEQPVTAPTTVDEPPKAKPEVRQFASSPSPDAPPEPKVATTEADAERRAEKKAPAEPASRAKLDEVTVRERDVQNKPQPEQNQVAAAPAARANSRIEVGRLAKGGAVAGASDSTKRGADDKTAKDEAAKEKNEAAAETRSVAGRRFRKTDDVWIDTAYDPSQQTLSMTRGSERFRALVADEPEIRQIAEQLSGEFVVVWKGRAYRIR